MEPENLFFYYAAWEFINVALEYTATAWVRLPHWFWAIVGVNLATHPLFMFLLERFGREPLFVLACEGVIWTVECILLMLLYRKAPKGRLIAAGVVMNAVSYAIGLMIA